MTLERGSRLTNVRDKSLEELDAFPSTGLEGELFLSMWSKWWGSLR
jgi:hypothetical protein